MSTVGCTLSRIFRTSVRKNSIRLDGNTVLLSLVASKLHRLLQWAYVREALQKEVLYYSQIP